MTRCYIGVGSNLGNPVAKAQTGIAAVAALTQVTLVAQSSLYSSKPMGPSDQPDYVNAVIAIETDLSPLTLLDALQTIELELGRERKDERWGPRTLDLDILLIEQQVIDSERLVVPHYGMKSREFVLYPLAEIAPKLVLPDGDSISKLIATCPRNGLQVLEQ
ncbi:2-amino-4-hydroxy-6-hydroxymethyldihydropteridine diphosphokinase [Psychrobium sp. 1_MG-2023]|uniref:2-amino-4-hydroxy-6- hydroxymethyldihydropteridine diphosphokinase n=1 Tax=Psychrobium sp. 1_MG-2023 TaxID=3062624 RepID=UPI000C326EBE|nr:2-amino-4-hydroxy-6-hydroxymethyldihydropteridine diphosphokinase [Psychrobium sp. 1_MG-2023]MDP2561490.1 2-amino-4-hydroxy-6-hydroxymethyldihydropteridine diphosphokinase [Psychrobium sp. 1_MG-2023]PKF57756.1 2-amino-4-hydroxy-6-hydroxymethyldihydropteridine diphosphokinase [Alteromonadales bacterium alter-6D02]